MSDKAQPPKGIPSLPNILTTSRILSIPFIVWGILTVGDTYPGFFGNPWVVIGLFILAGITDFLDGFLARRWNVTSDFGRMIDPIADKLLVAGCLIALCITADGGWMFLIPSMTIIGRDILVSGAREHAALSNRVMPPTNLAKWKTACEMLAIGLLIAWQAAQSWLPIDSAIPTFLNFCLYGGLGFLWLAAILSVYTGSLYFRASLKD